MDSAVWGTPGSQTPQYDAHPGARLRSEIYTAEMHTTEFLKTIDHLTPQYDAYRGAF